MRNLPILYKPTETEFGHMGEGVLRDAISCIVTENQNGEYELELKYPINGIKSELLNYDMIIKAKANEEFDSQLFRIYSIRQDLNHNKVIRARHIFYDLLDNFIEKLSLNNTTCTQAGIALLNACTYPTPFTFEVSDITHTGNFNIERVNPVQAIAGVDGSMVDTFGNGATIIRNNFKIGVKQNKTPISDVLIAHRKNLTGFERTVDTSNVATKIYPFAIVESQNGEESTKTVITLTEKYIDNPYIDNYANPKIIPYDFSGNDVTTEDQLRAKARAYFTDDRGLPDINYEISFVPLNKTVEYSNFQLLETVTIGTDITVFDERFNLRISTKVIKTVYDSLAGRYTSIELGKQKTNLAIDKIESEQKLEDKINNSNSSIENMNKLLINAIKNATDQITGADGGYVRLNPKDDPQEILIMDHPDISQAKNIWRFNKNGLGHSTTGYNGKYGLAMTADGQIVADKITSGSLNAGLIKVGILMCTNKNTWINMDTGTFNFGDKISFDGTNLTIRLQDGKTVEEGISAVNNKIDNVQIGGRNLLLYSNLNKTLSDSKISVRGSVHKVSIDTTNKYNGYNSLKIIATAPGNTSGQDVLWTSILGVSGGSAYGKNMIFSFYAKADSNVSLKARLGYGSYKVYSKVDLTTSWERYEINVGEPTNTSINGEVIFYLLSAGTVYISNAKLEEGTKATNWTPALEDVENDATNKATTALNSAKEYTNNQITTVNKTITDKVAEIKLTTDSITQRVSSAESTLTSTTATANNALTNANSANSKVDNLSIGGRNLILKKYFYETPFTGSGLIETEYLGKKCFRFSHGTVYGNGGKTNLFPNLTFKENTQYTLQVEWANSSGAGKGMSIILEYTDGSNTGINNHDGDNNYHYKMIVSDKNKTVKLIRCSYWYDGYTYLANIKLEEGNKPTTWTPAPEDVDSAITTVDTKITTANNKVASIETNLNGITQRVSSTETTLSSTTSLVNSALASANSANGKIDSLEVGGTNIIKGTNTISQIGSSSVWSSGTWRTASGGNATRTITNVNSAPNPNIKKGVQITATTTSSNGHNDIAQDSVPVTNGDTYTLSCYARKISGDTYLRLQYGKNPYPSITTKVDSTSWKKFNFTFTIGSVSDGSTDGSTNIYFGLANGYVGSIELCGLKLEKGNKATDWTPAPEDIDSAITSVDSKVETTNNKVASIETNLNSITSRVSSTESNITTINGNITNLTSRMNSAEQKITPSAIVSTVTSSTKYTTDLNSKANQSALNTTNNNVSSLTTRMSSAEQKITPSAIVSTVQSTINTAKTEAINSANSSTDTKLKNYATTSSLTQTTDKIIADFSSSGGMNLLKNSDAKNGSSYWVDNGGGLSIATAGMDPFLGEKEFKTSFPSGMSYYTSIRLKSNTDYVYEAWIYTNTAIASSNLTPLHFWCSSTADTSGQSQCTILDYRQTLEVNAYKKVYVHFRTKSGNVFFRPFIYSSATSGMICVKQISLSEGTIESAWTPHPDEVYSGSTIIDADGVTVKNGAIKVQNKAGQTVLSGDTNGNLVFTGIAKSQNGAQWVGLDSGGLLFQDWNRKEQMLRMGISYFDSNRDMNGITFAMPKYSDHIRFTHIDKTDLTNGWSSSDSQYNFMDFWSGTYTVGEINYKKGINVYAPMYVNNGIFMKSGTNHTSDIKGDITWNTINGLLGLIGDNGCFVGYKSGDSLQARMVLTEGAHPGTGDNIISWGHYNFNGYTFHNAKVNALSLSVSGSKNCLQKTENYGNRLINAYETAEYYFGDLGFGRINPDGECLVSIDDIFQECVNTKIDYHVFTQCYNGSIESIEKYETYFIVKGKPKTEFSWELKAKRISYENNRLDTEEIAQTFISDYESEIDTYKVDTSEDALLGDIMFDLELILMGE